MPAIQSQSESAERLLTVRQAAEALNVSPRFINKLLADGELERIKLGRCTRIRRDDIERLIRNGGAG